jgi:class 3 adenylate cyclase
MVDWSDLGVSGLLPTGTVTLLLADVEGSTRLWESQPDEMAAATAERVNTGREPVEILDRRSQSWSARRT